MADLTFYSSLRRGAALGITREDNLPAPTDPKVPRALLDVRLDYGGPRVANVNLPLVGPGDIVGLDPRSIVRTFPRPDDNEGEAGFMPYVEFDQVDLLWRYTPAHFTGTVETRNDRIRPWLSLLVLAEGSELASDDYRGPRGAEKLPQLTVRDGGVLPDLENAWAWAHVQGQELQTDNQIATTLGGRPGALIARLLAPRQLAEATAYRAFLVPTFQRGVLAGQGIDPKDEVDGLEPAWRLPVTAPILLPVYYSWRFQTGTVTSFREAVRKLRPTALLPPTVGTRAIDVSTPGFGLTSPTGGTAKMFIGGALQTTVQAGQSDPTPDPNWVRGLAGFIDIGKLQVGSQLLRVVSPPLYGRWYAAEDHLDRQGQTAPPTNPPWFSKLNGDPRYRVAAALGTEVVQRDQQALMAAAQDQASRMIDNVNRTRKVMQFGREVFTRLVIRHLGAGSPASTFLMTSFLHGKVFSCAGPTPRPTIDGTLGGTPWGRRPHPWRRTFPDDPGPLIDAVDGGGFNPEPNNPPGMATPDGTIGPEAPGGQPDPGVGTIINTMTLDQRLYWGVVIFWVARRLLSTEGGKYWWLLRRLLRLGLDLIALAGTQGVQGVTLLQKLRAGTLLGTDILALPQANNFTAAARVPLLGDPTTWPAVRNPVPGLDSPEARAFRTAAAALFDYVNGAPLPGRALVRANVPSLATCILNALSPAVTFVAAERNRHVLVGGITWNAVDQLEPILFAPKVGYPMWQGLRDISVDWILPGVGDLPRNSVSVLVTNQKFVEAFMLGLNQEMNRELLWNGYPTDQRGTFFQQFWDFRGWVGESEADRTEGQFADIRPIVEWERTNDLGAHSGRLPATTRIVLLVRGDVIKRYPNVAVYASKAIPAQGGGVTPDDSNRKHPVFQANLTGDIAFYSFELTVDVARGTGGDPGWFFVLQEHPSEPRFIRSGAAALISSPGDYGADAAAQVPANAFEPPTRVAILGKDLFPPQ